MGKRYLLDTNAIIDFCTLALPDDSHRLIANIVDETPTISVINKIELLSHSQTPASIEVFLTLADICPLDDTVIAQTISLRQKHKIKLPDAIIAATAITKQLILVTETSKILPISRS